MTDNAPLTLPAPAKLNLFLHVTGRRADGYHELQTAFQFISLYDDLTLSPLPRGEVRRLGGWTGVAEADDLALRAARLLVRRYKPATGVGIEIDKRIPAGAGLGGGSSDAATVLVALNRLWRLDLDVAELTVAALELGADVPVFVAGHAAWAEGVGERLTPIAPPESWYLLVVPAVHVATTAVFSDPALTRNTPPITIADFLAGRAHNDLERVVRSAYPEVDRVARWLARHGRPMMTGSGSGVFLPLAAETTGHAIADDAPAEWRCFIVRGMNTSPLQARLAQVTDWGVAKR